MRNNRLRVTPGAMIRMVADAILLQIALVLALAARFYVVVSFEGLADLTVSELLALYQSWYLKTAIPLTALCLLVFYLTGFYTRGVTYQSRYKVLVVIQAVSVSFLTYISVVLFFNVHAGKLSFAKSAMLLAWLFSILLLAGRGSGTSFGRRRWNRSGNPAAHPSNRAGSW